MESRRYKNSAASPVEIATRVVGENGETSVEYVSRTRAGDAQLGRASQGTLGSPLGKSAADANGEQISAQLLPGKTPLSAR